MYKDYKIVCVTPAGRRRYMRLLAPQILASPLVDRYDVWVNTEAPRDLAFFDALAKIDPRVRLVAQPDSAVNESFSIGAFHRLAVDADTIYIRFDDDVVWLQPDFFERHLDFRIANPDYLLTMPLIVNNAVCTALLEETGKVGLSRPVRYNAFDKIGWSDGQFAEAVHAMFLDLVEAGGWGRLHGGAYPIALNRFSINCICWFGHDIAAHPGMIGEEEEYDWTIKSSTATGRANCFATDTVVAHYAFFSQRSHMDRLPALARYEAWLMREPALAPMLTALARSVADIDEAKYGDERDGGVIPLRPTLAERLRDWSRHYRDRVPKIWLTDGTPAMQTKDARR